MADNSNRTSNLGPRVSHVTTKAFTAGPGHYLFPSWMTVEVDGPFNVDGAADFDGDADFASAVTMSGRVAMSGAVTPSGNVAFTGTFALGASGTSYSALRSSTVSINPGAVAANDSASTTATITLMPADAIILAAQPASIWSGAYFDLAITAKVSAASTLQVALANSTITSVTPDAMNWTVVYIDPS